MESLDVNTKKSIKIKQNNEKYLIKSNRSWRKDIIQNYELYLLVLPGVLYYIIFHYMPMVGVQIAFKNFSPALGMFSSEWVGLKHFNRFFSSYQFWTLIKNTLSISIYSLLVGFPLPIILALLLNEVRHRFYKKSVQMLTYAPHFISTVVIVSMLNVFFGQSSGLINNIRELFGFERIAYLGNANYFRHMYVWSGIWQSTGWSAIIYISALAGVSPELPEAAVVEGASKLQRIIYIDIPHILPTAITILIMNTGHLLSVGFEKVFLMQNAQNLRFSQVISTYVYNVGLISGQYSFSTAVGLFNSVVTFILLVIVNYLSKRVSETSLW